MNEETDNMHEYSHLDHRERKKIVVLRRRVEHLKKRIERSPVDLSYDKAELGALVWALGYIAMTRGREGLK